METAQAGIVASTKRLAEWTFSLQGVGADLKRLMVETKDWVRSRMAHWTDESPPPDPERERQRRLEDIISAAARAAARRATVEIRSSHNEGGNGRNGDKLSWKQIMTPLLAGTILGGGASAIATYARVGVIETQISESNKAWHQRMDDFVKANQQRHEETERRVSRLEQKVFP